jgi:hypothetical protein
LTDLVVIVVVGIFVLERDNFFVVAVLFGDFPFSDFPLGDFGELTHLLVGQEVAEGVQLGGDATSESFLQGLVSSP